MAQVVDTYKLQQFANDMVRNNPAIRKGQGLMNMLHTFEPECYHYVMSIDGADCFYHDKNIPNFWNAVYSWNFRVSGEEC